MKLSQLKDLIKHAIKAKDKMPKKDPLSLLFSLSPHDRNDFYAMINKTADQMGISPSEAYKIMWVNVSDEQKLKLLKAFQRVKSNLKEIWQRSFDQPRNPMFDDPSIASDRLNLYLHQLRDGHQMYIKSLIHSKWDEAKETMVGCNLIIKSIEDIFRKWADKMGRNDLMEIVGNAVSQIYEVLKMIIESIKNHNYIMIKKDTESLNRLYNIIRQSITELFEQEKET